MISCDAARIPEVAQAIADLPAVSEVYSTTGTLNRTLPKPPGLEPGSGLGVSNSSLYLVSLDFVITAVDKTTGAVQTSFTIPLASHGLTFAGSRNSLFVTVNDSPTVKEVSPAGVVLNTITIAATVRGLGFSSSSNILYGTRAGVLYAIDPNTGNAIGSPAQIQGLSTLLKTGALAADEVLSEFCGDGEINAPGGSQVSPSTFTVPSPQNSDSTSSAASAPVLSSVERPWICAGLPMALPVSGSIA